MSKKQTHTLNDFIANVVRRPKGAKGKYEIKKLRRKYLQPRKQS